MPGRTGKGRSTGGAARSGSGGAQRRSGSGAGQRRPDDRRRGGAPRREPADDPPRRIALEALTRVHRDSAFVNLILPPLLDAERLDRRDAGFATALTYGTLRLRGRYDAILAHCVDRPLDELDDVVLDVLRLGVHQILGMRVAAHGAVSATVDLAARAAGRGSAKLVNAVLRRTARRDTDDWLALLRREAPDETTALSRTQSHPPWIVKAMRQALTANGCDQAELADLLAADNTDPRVVLCARPGLITPEQLARAARAAAHEKASPGEYSPCAVVLPGGDPGRIAAVREGRAGVEDEGSQLTALILAEAPLQGRDEHWLNCSPGP